MKFLDQLVSSDLVNYARETLEGLGENRYESCGPEFATSSQNGTENFDEARENETVIMQCR